MIKDIKNKSENSKDKIYQIYMVDESNNTNHIDFAKYYDNDWHYEKYLGYKI